MVAPGRCEGGLSGNGQGREQALHSGGEREHRTRVTGNKGKFQGQVFPPHFYWEIRAHKSKPFFL